MYEAYNSKRWFQDVFILEFLKNNVYVFLNWYTGKISAALIRYVDT